MMTDLLQWWNLLFILPFILALLYILLLGVFTIDFGVDQDLGADPDYEINLIFFSSILNLLGVGKVPLSIILVSFLSTWGFTGFAANTLLIVFLPPARFIWISLFLAFLAALLITRILVGLLSKIMPQMVVETYTVSSELLVGQWAEAITRIDETFGQAVVHDDSGVLHTVQCLVKKGEPPIVKGSRVLLMIFDKESSTFWVAC